MKARAFAASPGRPGRSVDPSTTEGADGWMWIDVELDADDTAADLDVLLEGHGFDPLAINDAVADENIPKYDNFDDHLMVVLHGISDTAAHTYEIDCFLNADVLVTIHRTSSPSLDAFAKHVRRSVELAAGGPDELLARLSDVIGRRFLGVVDQLDARTDELTSMALQAHPRFLEELTILRGELGDVRWVLRPQREVFDALRSDPSPILTDAGRRRFSDVYDVAQRTVHEFDAVRTALAEALGAYQGAEARAATEITKVLTIYAAIMLPLSLIAGFFGMNFIGLPGAMSANASWWVLGLMLTVAIASLGFFAAAGWIRLPGRTTNSESPERRPAARVPAHVVSALYRHSDPTSRDQAT